MVFRFCYTINGVKMYLFVLLFNTHECILIYFESRKGYCRLSRTKYLGSSMMKTWLQRCSDRPYDMRENDTETQQGKVTLNLGLLGRNVKMAYHYSFLISVERRSRLSVVIPLFISQMVGEPRAFAAIKVWRAEKTCKTKIQGRTEPGVWIYEDTCFKAGI